MLAIDACKLAPVSFVAFAGVPVQPIDFALVPFARAPVPFQPIAHVLVALALYAVVAPQIDVFDALALRCVVFALLLVAFFAHVARLQTAFASCVRRIQAVAASPPQFVDQSMADSDI